MRTRIGFGFGIAAAMMLGIQADVRAQTSPIYPTAPAAGVTPPGAHAFKDEPVMSINNSYLGYSNFVDPDHPAPRYILGRPQAQGSTPRPRARLFGFGRRRGR